MSRGTGNGWTLALATTGSIGNIRKITNAEAALPKIDASHLGTVDVAESIPGDLEEPGELTVEVEFDTGTDEPARGTIETVTVTAKLRSGESVAAKWAGSGFITKVKRPDAANNELSVYTVTIAWDGVTGPTFTAAS